MPVHFFLSTWTFKIVCGPFEIFLLSSSIVSPTIPIHGHGFHSLQISVTLNNWLFCLHFHLRCIFSPPLSFAHILSLSRFFIYPNLQPLRTKIKLWPWDLLNCTGKYPAKSELSFELLLIGEQVSYFFNFFFHDPNQSLLYSSH